SLAVQRYEASRFRQIPGLVEKSGPDDVTQSRAILDGKQSEVALAGQAEIAWIFTVFSSHPGIQRHISRRVERIGINESRQMHGGGEASLTQSNGLARPAKRQLSVQIGDPAVAAWIAEQHHVVFRQVCLGNVLVIFDQGMTAEVLGVEPVEARQR